MARASRYRLSGRDVVPYLDRLGLPYFVLVRSRDNFEEVRKLTSAR